MYLRCATENSADVVVGFFSGAVAGFGLPCRVHSGYENASVALVMNLIRGLQHHAHMTGRSVHNQRIERLWRDVHKEVTEVNATVCDPKSKACTYSTCVDCSDKSMYVDDAYRTMKSKVVQVPQWVNKADDNGYTITSKEVMNFTIEELVEQHEKTMPLFRKHQFNIRNQYAAYRKIREEQVDEDMLIHIDFAENYVSRYAAEIQSVHFGGSHDQATLHTGIAYVNKHLAPFCTISDSKVHSTEAIWTYLSPCFHGCNNRYHKESEG